MIRWIVCFVLLVIGGLIVRHEQLPGKYVPRWILGPAIVSFLLGLAGTCANTLFLLAGWDAGW
jgi:hypothetical protein